jgi:lipopolysaccharide export system protein LptA
MRRRAEAMALAALVALALPGPSLALPDDRSRAIEISANRAVRDERRGFTLYSGDVVLTQGSLRIEADRLTIFHDREAADRIVAEGTPAQMQQQPEVDQEPVTARAGRITYFKSSERVLLSEAASIEQSGAVVTGETIEYLMREQQVRADADATDESARVQVVIPAEVIEAQQEGDEAPVEGEGKGEPEPGPDPDAAPTEGAAPAAEEGAADSGNGDGNPGSP